MNNVVLTGRLGQDVELKYTTNGQTVANLRLATNEGFGDNRKTYWFDVVAWAKTAEIAAKYLQKGSLVAIEGKLQVREYEDKSGNKKKVYEVIARNIEFLGGTKEQTETAKTEPTDDDIPF